MESAIVVAIIGAAATIIAAVITAISAKKKEIRKRSESPEASSKYTFNSEGGAQTNVIAEKGDVYINMQEIIHPQMPSHNYDVAVRYCAQKDYKNAIKYLELALTDIVKTAGPYDLDAGACHQVLGTVFCELGQYEEAIEHYNNALSVYAKYDDCENRIDQINNNFAVMYQTLGFYEKADIYFQKVLQYRETTLGKDHPDTASAYNNLAESYRNQNLSDKALCWYEKALDIQERVLGEEHVDTALTYNNIGLINFNLGLIEKAEMYFIKACKIREKLLGRHDPQTAASYNNISMILIARNDGKGALEYQKKALVIYENIYGKNHPEVAVLYNNIGNAYYKQQAYSFAIQWYEKALEIAKKNSQNYVVSSLYNNIAVIYDRLGDDKKSMHYYDLSMQYNSGG